VFFLLIAPPSYNNGRLNIPRLFSVLLPVLLLQTGNHGSVTQGPILSAAFPPSPSTCRPFEPQLVFHAAEANNGCFFPPPISSVHRLPYLSLSSCPPFCGGCAVLSKTARFTYSATVSQTGPLGSILLLFSRPSFASARLLLFRIAVIGLSVLSISSASSMPCRYPLFFWFPHLEFPRLSSDFSPQSFSHKKSRRFASLDYRTSLSAFFQFLRCTTVRAGSPLLPPLHRALCCNFGKFYPPPFFVFPLVHFCQYARCGGAPPEKSRRCGSWLDIFQRTLSKDSCRTFLSAVPGLSCLRARPQRRRASATSAGFLPPPPLTVFLPVGS